MKLNKLLAVAAVALVGCQDHFDQWTPETPVANERANISIMEFKEAFWMPDTCVDPLNYTIEVPAREDGSHYIVSGRVISSDENSNVFKSLYIQDESGALPISINQYSLYISNRVGQDIVLDLTGMYCGMYRGMFQLGFPKWNADRSYYETSFMAPEFFLAHRELNGNPEPSKVDTLLISDLSEITSADAVMQWQGQLVRFNNVTFATPGTSLVDKYHSSGSEQDIKVNGGTIKTRNSGYATFWNMDVPAQPCDVVGILGYYQSSSTAAANDCYQLVLLDKNSIMNIGNPTNPGSQLQPYSVEEAIALAGEGFSEPAWVSGYIVGTLAPEVTTVESNNDIQWTGTEPYIIDNYVVLAATPEVRDYRQCILVPLSGELQQAANLVENPAAAGRVLNIRGRFTTQMGMTYLSSNSGDRETFELK